MSKLGGWVGRHRIAAGFAAGALLTLLAVAVVGYLVLADQHRSARVLAAALSQALARDVHIDRVTEMNPSRVVMKGIRLSKERGWPADIVAESVEASGPLLAAARGAAAPIQIQVTRPTISAGGDAAGLAALEGLRQGIADFLASPAVLDVAVTGGMLEAPTPASEAMTFDASLRKGPGSVRGEVLLRDRGQARFGLGLDARPEGDTVRLALSGEGQIAPLAPWLPPAVVRAVGPAPVELRAQLGLEPGDRLAGRISSRLGDLVTLEGTVSLREGLLRLAELRGAADLGFIASASGRTDPIRGRAELTDGEVSWSPERGGWPSARADLRLVDATLPPAVAGSEVRVQGLETRLTLEPREALAVLRGELHGDRVGAAGIELAPVSTSWLVDLGAGGAVTRAELSGLTAQVLGVAVRGTVTHHALRARTDARLETAAARLDPLLRKLGMDWLGPSDQIRAGSLRVVATDLDAHGWTQGKVDADIRELALKQADGETRVGRARVGAIVQGGSAAITLETGEVQGAAPYLQGVLPRVEGSADVVRADLGAGLKRASLVARDAQGREMVLADLSRLAPGITGPMRLTVRSPALERLGSLWPAIQRQVTGSAAVELLSADGWFETYEGRLDLKIPSAELLDAKVSLRDVSGDVPIRRGGPARAAGLSPGGPITVGELIGHGVVLHDASGQARLVDYELGIDGLRYLLYSGQGQGTLNLKLGDDGLSAGAHLTGEGVRIEEFVAAYGIRGGTMTGLLRYDLKVRYREGRLAADGRAVVPEGGTVTIELLDKFLSHASADPTGVVRRALGNLREFDFKAAELTARTASDDIRVTLELRGRERFGIFPPRVREINIRDMPLGFLARQFPSQ
jgi:hypothetical protein